MKLSISQIRSPEFNTIFGGALASDNIKSSTDDWHSRLPDITSLSEAASVDDAIFDSAFGSGDASKYFAGLANVNVISAGRQMTGSMVQSVGLSIDMLANLHGMYRDPIDIYKSISALVMQTVDLAFNAIGIIPVVGWIIKAIYEAGNMIADTIQAVRDAKEAAARNLLAMRYGIPLKSLSGNSDADEAVTRSLFDRILNTDGGAQSIIMPRHSGKMAGIRVENSPNDELGVGWVWRGTEVSGGFGFIPGTSGMQIGYFAAVDPHSPNGGLVRNLNSLYPTAPGVAFQWWETMLQRGPALFTADPKKAMGAWENHILTMLEDMAPASDSSRSGVAYLGSPTSDSDSSYFKCIQALQEDWPGCRASTRGEDVALPSRTGSAIHAALWMKIIETFWGTHKTSEVPVVNDKTYRISELTTRFPKPDSVDYKRSVPNIALQNLYDRQKAAMNSRMCAYVNDGPAFPGVAGDAWMSAKWEENVKAILNTSEWKNISYEQVPEGEFKVALAAKAAANGYSDPMKLNPVDRACLLPRKWAGATTADGPFRPMRCSMLTTLTSGVSIFGDPSLPGAPAPVLLLPGGDVGNYGQNVGKTGTSSGGGLMLAAAAAAIIIAMSKKKRR